MRTNYAPFRSSAPMVVGRAATGAKAGPYETMIANMITWGTSRAPHGALDVFRREVTLALGKDAAALVDPNRRFTQREVFAPAGSAAQLEILPVGQGTTHKVYALRANDDVLYADARFTRSIISTQPTARDIAVTNAFQQGLEPYFDALGFTVDDVRGVVKRGYGDLVSQKGGLIRFAFFDAFAHMGQLTIGNNDAHSFGKRHIPTIALGRDTITSTMWHAPSMREVSTQWPLTNEHRALFGLSR